MMFIKAKELRKKVEELLASISSNNEAEKYLFSASTVLSCIIGNSHHFSKINENQESVPWKK